ncbi:zona pellucida sperm-binding protein 3-like isoform X1 [Entelurus aequoreus]|uniref:zona pellucida sperm-binding protein 3-like isoform X1 n=1 Tax=Entelurus aequoreus TaxID=161455 RepID=UPI002B1E52A8|nr:zona pellucida sperm-binding protein 3-like isoform X1 [Entelurus aequoreus]
MQRRYLYFLFGALALVGLNGSSLALMRERKLSKSQKASTSNKFPAPVLMASLGHFQRASQPRSTPFDFAYLPDVSVTCSTTDLVVRVKPSFFGFGADESELKLGSNCKGTGVLRPYGDFLFTYPLTACDSRREATRDFLVYKYILHYEPSSNRFPRRKPQIDVDIECRYQRYHHVYKLAVKPTWQAAVVRKTLKAHRSVFLIQMMDDSWKNPVNTRVYQLGQKVHVQVSAPHLPAGRKLYINSCHASLASSSSSSHKYTIIGHLGCMLDSKRYPGGASQFISHTNKTLRFSFQAFQFISNPDKEIRIHCKLFVTSEKPGPAHKSCTYKEDRWRALSGDDSICECCDSRCETFKSHKTFMEGSVRSALLVADEPLAEEGLLPVRRQNHLQHPSANGFKNDEDEGTKRLILEKKKELAVEKFANPKRKKSEESVSNEFGENGSGYEVEDDFSERLKEELGRKLVQVNQTKGKALHEWLQSQGMLASQVTQQRNVKQLEDPGDEEKRNRTNGTGTLFFEVHNDEQGDDKERTWYFSWR